MLRTENDNGRLMEAYQAMSSDELRQGVVEKHPASLKEAQLSPADQALITDENRPLFQQLGEQTVALEFARGERVELLEAVRTRVASMEASKRSQLLTEIYLYESLVPSDGPKPLSGHEFDSYYTWLTDLGAPIYNHESWFTDEEKALPYFKRILALATTVKELASQLDHSLWNMSWNSEQGAEVDELRLQYSAVILPLLHAYRSYYEALHGMLKTVLTEFKANVDQKLVAEIYTFSREKVYQGFISDTKGFKQYFELLEQVVVREWGTKKKKQWNHIQNRYQIKVAPELYSIQQVYLNMVKLALSMVAAEGEWRYYTRAHGATLMREISSAWRMSLRKTEYFFPPLYDENQVLIDKYPRISNYAEYTLALDVCPELVGSNPDLIRNIATQIDTFIQSRIQMKVLSINADEEGYDMLRVLSTFKPNRPAASYTHVALQAEKDRCLAAMNVLKSHKSQANPELTYFDLLGEYLEKHGVFI